MEFFEAAVLAYLTAPPNRFVSPQFSLPYEAGVGGSCPDFVVLDFGKLTVYVVEVTSASKAGPILSRVQEREPRWITPLRAHLSKMSPQLCDWKYRVTLFVREEICADVRQATAEMLDVFVVSLDNVVFSWRWDWKGQLAVNPLE